MSISNFFIRSIAGMAIAGMAMTSAGTALAQSSDNVNDVFDSSGSQTEFFGDNGLNIHGLMEASKNLERDDPWGLRDGAVEEEVTRYRNSRDRQLGPDIFSEEPEVSPSTEVELEGEGTEVAP